MHTHDEQSHHAHMVDDFRRRFWVSLALTVPVLATSEMIQHFFGLRAALAFPGDRYVEFARERQCRAETEEVLDHLGRREHRNGQRQRYPEATAEVVHHVGVMGLLIVRMHETPSTYG